MPPFKHSCMVAIAVLATALAAPPLSAKPTSKAVAPSVVPVPKVEGPVPVTENSWPFAAANHAVTNRDLSQDGYVEEEYFISGEAHVYDWPALGELETFTMGPYTTRILVRKPANPEDFNGTVVVEALNPSIRYDAPVMWMESQDHFITRGYAYVGVTVKAVAVQSLKLFDPERYASLSFKNPLPPTETCGQADLPPAPGGLPPESTPATENGLIWDILSQAGILARGNSPASPLAGYDVSRVYLTGDSQSGAFALIYANAIHPFAHRPNGEPIFDGYLTASAGGPGVPVNQCAPGIRPGDPRMEMQPRGVPIIKLINQTDIRYLNRRPDSDTPPDLYRSYEIAGAAHVHDWVLEWGASDEDVAKTGAAGFLSNAMCKQRNEKGNWFPTHYVLDGAWDNLDRWSREGTPPPHAEPLDVRDPRNGRETLQRDEVGNAKGGLRIPYVDVPLVRYGVYMDGPGICELWGYEVPLGEGTLDEMYPGGKADYIAKVRAATEKAVKDRRITPEDGTHIFEEAKKAPFN